MTNTSKKVLRYIYRIVLIVALIDIMVGLYSTDKPSLIHVMVSLVIAIACVTLDILLSKKHRRRCE